MNAKCPQIFDEDLHAYALKVADPATTLRLGLHLLICPTCRARAEHHRWLSRAMSASYALSGDVAAQHIALRSGRWLLPVVLVALAGILAASSSSSGSKVIGATEQTSCPTHLSIKATKVVAPPKVRKPCGPD